MSKARDLANLLGGGTSGAITFGGTAAIRVPNGTTAQRPTPAAGMIRYNTTTGFAEVYDGNVWAEFGAPPPSISTVTPSTYNGESGTTFTINGANFTADATVFFVTSGGTEVQAGSVSFVSGAQLTATTPQDFAIADEPLDVKVVQASGQITKVDVIDCGGVPAWNTASGTIATINDQYGSYSPIATVSASDPDSGATITYSLASGSLPAGTSLNSSTGAISGDPTNVASQTTSNFTLAATDNAGNETQRAFSIIVNPFLDGLTEAKASPSGTYLYNVGLPSGIYWIKPFGYPTALQTYVDNTYDGGGWVMVFAYYKNQPPVDLVSNYFTSPQNAATVSGASLSSIATPNDPLRSFCMPAAWWQAFGSDNNGQGELREEYAISGGTWPNNTNRVAMYHGGRTSGGAAGNYLTSSNLTDARTVLGFNGRGTVSAQFISVSRHGYLSNNIGTPSPYAGLGSNTILGISLDANPRASGSTATSDGINSYTNQDPANGSSWMGRGNGYELQGSSTNGGNPDGTRWGLVFIR